MSRRIRDLTGQIFGRLTAIRPTDERRCSQVVWECRCECGKVARVVLCALVNHSTKSCGCLLKENGKKWSLTKATKHGMVKSRVYIIWGGMIQRCNNPKSASYHFYGGKGISVCDEWLDFQNFYHDMGEPPSPTHQIDRIDSNGNYCHLNCRWATPKQNSRNTYKTIYLEHNGLRLPLQEWAERTGIDHKVLWARLRRLGWPVEKAITKPVKAYRRNQHVS